MIPSIYAIQKLFGELGEAGCHVICQWLTACDLVGQNINFVDAVIRAINDKMIYYNDHNPDDPKNCNVLDGPGCMASMTGLPRSLISYQYIAGPTPYIFKAGETGYEEWLWTHTVKNEEVKTTHFVRQSYDPLGNSLTKQNGHLFSTRVYKLVA